MAVAQRGFRRATSPPGPLPGPSGQDGTPVAETKSDCRSLPGQILSPLNFVLSTTLGQHP